ncbi:hypothetical protein HN51_032208, partial [Arachis hypogaea]
HPSPTTRALWMLSRRWMLSSISSRVSISGATTLACSSTSLTPSRKPATS